MEINLVLPPKTYDPPSHHPEPAGFSVTWEDAASDSFIGKQCLLPNFWPSSRLLGFVYLFLEWCVCCICVCVFRLFFEAISSTSSFLLHERHMKSYIH